MIGLLFLFLAICIIFAVFILGLGSTYIAIGATLSALGIIAILPGIGLFFKGRQVDKMLSGEDLIASWNYSVDENGKRKTGYVYIGTKGFFKDGFYVWWSNKCVLQDILFEEGNPAILTFHYVRYARHFDIETGGGGGALKNNFPVPVPPDKKHDAMRAIQYYKQKLQEKFAENAIEPDKT